VGEPRGGRDVGREKRIAEGVSVRFDGSGKATSIRIGFQYRGEECRERLDLIPTKPNQRFAIALRGEIVSKIARGEFNYADYAAQHFPSSKNVARFGAIATTRTVGDLLDDYEKIAQPTVEASTWLSYSKVIKKYLRPWFGATRLRELTPLLIESKVLSADITLKTARNILSPLNMALRRAVSVHRELPANPLASVDLALVWPKDRKKSGWVPDPFSFDEMTAIFAACDDGPEAAEADYWRTAFGTGMRPSEQIEIHWPRVELATVSDPHRGRARDGHGSQEAAGPGREGPEDRGG
jgi:integrase